MAKAKFEVGDIVEYVEVDYSTSKNMLGSIAVVRGIDRQYITPSWIFTLGPDVPGLRNLVRWEAKCFRKLKVPAKVVGEVVDGESR